MKANKLIIFGVGAALVFFLIVYNATSIEEPVVKVEQHSPIISPPKLKTIDGDSTADSYKALEISVQQGVEEKKVLQGEVEGLTGKLKRYEKDFEQYKKEQNKKLETVLVQLGGTPEIKPSEEKAAKGKLLKNITNYKHDTVKKDAPFEFKSPFEIKEDSPIKNFKLGKKNNSLNNSASRTYDKNDKNAGWIMPLGVENKAKSLSRKENKKNTGRDTSHRAMSISDNSILYNAKALTYLVGRIPVNGRVSDPFPVKIIVGNEVLLANGHSLPGVEGMYFSGYATGDMNLGCIRAEMNSYTFIFSNGKQVTFRDKPTTGTSGEEPMAYISDRFGLPCVMGTFVSNVSEFLGIKAGLTGLAVGGEAFAAAQTNNSTTPFGGSNSVVDGSVSSYALGKVVSGAVSDVGEWMLARQESSFDAVVAPSGTEVSLHLNRTINIDYDEAARSIDYQFDVNKQVYLD